MSVLKLHGVISLHDFLYFCSKRRFIFWPFNLLKIMVQEYICYKTKNVPFIGDGVWKSFAWFVVDFSCG